MEMIMKITGVIMECNPFHEGHRYFLEQARTVTGCDRLIAVMSGDYVQRGEPAILPKEIRARALLEHGADLVLELPLYYACGGAEYFARGAVTLLDRLGAVTDLCFGSECGSTEEILRAARTLYESEGDPAWPDLLLGYQRRGMSFPAAREAAIRELTGSDPVPRASNDLLAAEYIRTMLGNGSPMIPHAIPRTDARSATDLRQMLLTGRSGPDGLRKGLPEELPAVTRRLLETEPRPVLLGPDHFSQALFHALLSAAGSLTDYADVTPDLADRLEGLLPAFNGYSAFTDLIRTRNLTRTRVSRCLLHILLGIRADRLRAYAGAGTVGYARVLGFRRTAGPLLKRLGETASLPLLARPARDRRNLSPLWQQMLEEEVRAALLYDMTAALSAGRTCNAPLPVEYEKPLLIL